MRNYLPCILQSPWLISACNTTLLILSNLSVNITSNNKLSRLSALARGGISYFLLIAKLLFTKANLLVEVVVVVVG